MPGFVDYDEECFTPTTVKGPYIFHSCGSDAAALSALKANEPSCSAVLAGSGLAGDPVDLKTGVLSQDPVDVDLGGGLRFARHYASSALMLGGTPRMGQKWSHSLDWRISRGGTTQYPVINVKEPMRPATPFVFDGTAFVSSTTDGATLAVESNGTAHFVSSAGVEADFSATDSLTRIAVPDEIPIDVTPNPGANQTTFTRGSQSIVITTFPSGSNIGKVRFVDAAGERWTYDYQNHFLKTVTGPDPSTADNPTDETTWTYNYTTLSSGLLNSVLRRTTSAPTDETIAAWSYLPNDPLNRIETVDEQALVQPIKLVYSTPQSGISRTSVLSTANQPTGELLARFDVDAASPRTGRTGSILSVTNGDGPAAPVPGGAGIDVPFIEQTTTSENSPLIQVQTDKRTNKTLYQDYNGKGKPGVIVQGWIDDPDGTLIGVGSLTSDDEFASLRTVTQWHPSIWRPLIEQSPSVLSSGEQRSTTTSYIDPLAPGQGSTTRLYSRSDTGFTLDEFGSTVSKTYTMAFTYNADRQLTTASGPRLQQFTEHIYDTDSKYRIATRRYLNGQGSDFLETTYSDHDIRGNPQTITDANLQVTSFEYDTLSRVRSVTTPFSGPSSEIKFSYDIDGNLTGIEFPDDTDTPPQPYTLNLDYDSRNQLRFIKDSGGNAIVYERARPGRVTRQATYSGFVDLNNPGVLRSESAFDYDMAGRLIKTFNPLFPLTSPNEVVTSHGPDPNGNPTNITDENGKADSRLYDALDRLTKISQIRGATTFVTEFEYDLSGRVKNVRDPAARNTQYQNDDFGRLVRTTSPNTGVTIFVYDEAGNLITKKENFNGAARTTRYTYDGLNRLLTIDLHNDPDWTFTYDTSDSLNQKGRLASVSNGIVTTQREYTARGEVKLERTIIGGTSYPPIQFDYDATGNLKTVSAPSGTTAAYTYAGARPETITIDPGANQDQRMVRNIAFAPFGGRTRADFPPFDSGTGLNTVISTRSYNKRGQVESVQVSASGGTVLSRTFDYARTAGGVGPTDRGPNLDQVTDSRDGSLSRFFFYDSLDRLQKSSNLSGSPLNQYAYDENGNRTSETSGGTVTGTTYASGTDLVAASGFSFGYGSITTYYHHDAYGNRIWEGLLAPYSGQPMHFYDDQNRLVEYRYWTNLSVPMAQYAYDAFGRRVRKVTSGATTLYFYDLAGHLIEERVLSTGTTRNYVWLEDEPVGIVDSGSTPTYSWVHTDYLGMPIAVTSTPGSGSAQTIWRANYAPYGLAGEFKDPDGNGQQFSLALRLPGQYHDGESNYHYNWHRYYDPSIGRYISADPIGWHGGINAYAYVNNNSTNRIDPSGLGPRPFVPSPSGFARGLERAGSALASPVTAFSLRSDGFDAADAHPLALPGPGQNDFENNFRHCLTSCLANDRYGPQIAETLGDLNELKSGESTPCGQTTDAARDQLYNEIGREIAAHGSGEAGCHTQCADAAMSGQ